AAQIGTKVLRIELPHRLVAVAMRGQLVTQARDPAYQLGLALGHPAQDEERGLQRSLREQAEEALHADLHPGRQLVPARRRKRRPEVQRVEVFLDVDGDRVQHAVHRNASSSAGPKSDRNRSRRRSAPSSTGVDTRTNAAASERPMSASLITRSCWTTNEH